MCFTKKEWIVFFAGAEAFHTLSHLLLYISAVPFYFYGIIVTPQLNLWAFVINAIITLWLIWWANKS